LLAYIKMSGHSLLMTNTTTTETTASFVIRIKRCDRANPNGYTQITMLAGDRENGWGEVVARVTGKSPAEALERWRFKV
jgi:hypothetical protein